ncbi:MAG: D-cysteine desulfhydrase family protein [Agarilytica sp.]
MLPPPPPKLSLANLPTPIRPLDRVSTRVGGPRIWLKQDDYTGSLSSGNKIRKLEYLLAEAQAQGCDTVITCGGIQSNHCRATAALCAQLGLHCYLILRGPKSLGKSEICYSPEQVCEAGSEGNLLLDQLCGAEISIYSPFYYAKHLDALFDNAKGQCDTKGRKSYSIPVGGSNETGLWGYITAAKELQNDFKLHNITPGAVVCASGSGGTQGGLTLGFHLLSSSASVHGVAVCDSGEYFKNKILEDVSAWEAKYLQQTSTLTEQLNINTFEGYIGPGYAQAYPELLECIAMLAQEEGVVLDPVYTGKAFYGLIKEIEKGTFSAANDIVFIHTGGIYGLFPFKNEFVF